MGSRRNFSRGGKTSNTLKSWHVFGEPYKKSTIFRRAEAANENFCAFRDVLDWNIGYLWRALEARAKMLGYFVGRQQMTSFFRIPGGQVPCPSHDPTSPGGVGHSTAGDLHGWLRYVLAMSLLDPIPRWFSIWFNTSSGFNLRKFLPPTLENTL